MNEWNNIGHLASFFDLYFIFSTLVRVTFARPDKISGEYKISEKHLSCALNFAEKTSRIEEIVCTECSRGNIGIATPHQIEEMQQKNMRYVAIDQCEDCKGYENRN